MKMTIRYFPVLLLAGMLTAGSVATNALPGPAAHERPGISQMLARATPAVVSITVSGTQQVQQNPLLEDPFFRRFFNTPDQPQERQVQGAGSGVIIDAENGYVLTNHHVVGEADEIEITLSDRRSFTGKLIGSDPGTDIALVQIKADNLVAIELSDSDTLRVGDYVAAIGNPFNIGETVTTGIVSATGRQTNINGAEGFEDFIQTDASINPGNSGGALVDFNGALVGINSSIISPAGGNVGIGFAVPINMAMAVVDQLIEYGEVHRGLLGVQISDLTPDVVDALDLKVSKGAVVASVVPDSPAEKAGIVPGDVIVAVDGEQIEGASDLRNTIGLTRAGKNVEIGLLRDNKRQDISVQIGNAPKVDDSHAGTSITSVMEGADIANIPSGHEAYGRVKGVLVTAVAQGSRAWRNGLQEGDIIMAVNRQPVTSASELQAIMNDNQGTVALNISRDGQALFLIMR